MSDLPSKYVIHVIIYELDPENDDVRDLLEEDEVKGCQDEYTDLEEVKKDFNKVKKYIRDPHNYEVIKLND